MKRNLGQYLKQIRKEKKLSLRAVQHKTGISNAYLSQLENDKAANPSPKILRKLAICYEVAYEHLMALAGYSFSSKKELEPAYRLSDILTDLSPEEKQRVREYIEFLKSRREVK